MTLRRSPVDERLPRAAGFSPRGLPDPHTFDLRTR